MVRICNASPAANRISLTLRRRGDPQGKSRAGRAVV